MVYDPEPGDGKFLVPGDRDKKGSAHPIDHKRDSSSARESISADDSASQNNPARDGSSENIRARENQFAAGKGASTSGLGLTHPDPEIASKSAEAKSRDELRDSENSIPFVSDPKYANDQPSGNSTRTFLKGKGRKKYVAAALITSLLGGGAGFGLLGAASGPLQLIHLSETLIGDHMAVNDDQSDTRVTQLWRFARFYNKGTPERARLGLLGNKLADKAEARLNQAGFKSLYNSPAFGFFSGYLVDTHALRGGVFNNMSDYDRTPQGFQEFMKRNFDINVKSIGNGRFHIPPDQLKGRGFTRLTRNVIKGTNTPRMAWISARFAAARGGVSLHPIAKLNNVVPKSIEYVKAWNERRRSRALNGAAAPAPGVTQAQVPGADGQPAGDAPGSDASKNAVDDLKQAAAAAHSGGEAKAELRKKISAKVKTAAGVMGVFEILCLALAVFVDVEEEEFKNVRIPAERVGMEMVAVGATLQSGTDLSLGASGAGAALANPTAGFIKQLDLYGEKLYDEKTKTGFMEAESIQRNHGREGGVATPPQVKLGAKDGILTKLFTYLTDAGNLAQLLDKTCHVVNNAVFGIVVSAGLVITGVASVAQIIAGYAFSLIALPVLIDYLVDMLSGSEIDTDVLAGAPLGSVSDYGVKHFANDEAISNGAQALPAKEYAALRNDSLELSKQEFQSKSLAYRLFDAHDSRSFAAQIIDQQDPDPVANTARYVGGFFNIGHSFASMFGGQLRLLTGKADAAVLPYDYGFPTFGFSQADLDSPEFQDPYGNAENVAAKLEADNVAAGAAAGAAGGAVVAVDNVMAKRITACTGDNLEKTVDNEGNWQWGIGKPVTGQIPTYPSIERGSAKAGDAENYNCTDKSAEWRAIRSFIAYSKTMNAVACYDLDTKDVDAAKACGDLGLPTAPVVNEAI